MDPDTILPERRKNPERITPESIMAWARMLFDSQSGTKDIYYIRVTIEEYKGNSFWPAPRFLAVANSRKVYQ